VEREAVCDNGIPVPRIADGLAARAGRIQHLHAFRGFAIINIVAVHVFSTVLKAASAQADPGPAAKWIGVFNEILFHGSTLYFALISGLLFTVALRRRGWQRFFRNKVTNVIAPYIVMSLLFTMIKWYLDHGFPSAGNPPAAFFGTFLSNLWLGMAQPGYWYIPVIVVLFAATPLLAVLVTGRHAGIGILVVGTLPLFLTRSGVEVTPGTLIYFAGMYAVGMYMGENYPGNLERLRRWRWAFGAIAATSTAFLALLFARDMDLYGGISLRESLFYLQKLALSGLLLVFLQRWEHRLPGALDQLASHAFAIYFLHQFVIKVLIRYSPAVFPPSQNGGMLVALSLSICGSALALSWLVSRSVKGVCGRHSKWLIGA
jgi:peptidoglycan/LPS O-acetylase OafA/YrhL